MVHTDYLRIQAGKQQDACTSLFQPVTFWCVPGVSLSSVFPGSRFFTLGTDVIHMCFVSKQSCAGNSVLCVVTLEGAALRSGAGPGEMAQWECEDQSKCFMGMAARL